MSKFIVFEGPDGSGKSTQFSYAASYLNDFYDLYVTKEPTTEPSGKLIKEMMNKDKDSRNSLKLLKTKVSNLNKAYFMTDKFLMPTCLSLI